MPNDAAVSMQNNMRALTQRYLENLGAHYNQIERVLHLAECGALGEESRTELKFQAHKLAGTGTTYGFPAISETGRRVEEMLIDHPGDSETLIALIHDLLNACSSAMHTHPSPVELVEEKPFTPALAVGGLPLVLIVDDDANVRSLLSSLLQNDARLLTGVNAAEALDLMYRHKPDLVLLDNKMPGDVTGVRLLEDIQNIPELRHIPIVLITASGKPEEVMRGLMAGAADYITKPFDPLQVTTKIRERLRRQHNAILIADDDEAVRELLEHKFRSAGCKVVCAFDGTQALERMQEQHFALVVLDRMMPGFDGMTLLRMMKRNTEMSTIPVVFLTARHYGSDVLDGLNMGAADYITKPFNPDEVVTRCIRLLENPAYREI
jgi:DNA-binding response OmpR family regulator